MVKGNLNLPFFLKKKQIIMAEKDNKNEGPTCACGRVDIYKEMLKHEKKLKEESETTLLKQTEDSSNKK